MSEYVSWLETFHREIPNLKGRAVGDALARSSRIVVTKAEKGHRMFEMRPPGAPPLAPLTLAPAAPSMLMIAEARAAAASGGDAAVPNYCRDFSTKKCTLTTGHPGTDGPAG